MLDKFKNLGTFSKVLIIGGAVLILAVIGLVIAVVATGGFNGIRSSGSSPDLFTRF